MTPQPVTPHDKAIRVISILLAAAITILILLPSSVISYRLNIIFLWAISLVAFAVMGYRCYYARKQGMTRYLKKMIIMGGHTSLDSWTRHLYLLLICCSGL